MQIDVISDTICPWCYIGKRRLEKALAQRPDIDFEIVWRPYQLNPDMPPKGMDRKTYLETKFGNKDQANKIYSRIADMGREEGLEFAIEKQKRLPSTIDSHRLNHWAQTAGVQDAVVELLFQKYFIDGEDISDPEVLLAIAEEAGMDGDVVRELLAGDADRDLVLKEEAIGRRMGVSGVPCFVVDQKLALVGAQDPETLLRAIDQVIQTHAEEDASDAAE